METQILSLEQKKINYNLKLLFDIEKVKSKLKDILEFNDLEIIKIFKSPLWFYQIVLFDNAKYTIRIHFYEKKHFQTNIHMHWYSAYSYVLSWKIKEEVFTTNASRENPLLDILADVWLRHHLSSFYNWLDDDISKALSNQNTEFEKTLLKNLWFDKMSLNLFLKLIRSPHTKVSYSDWNIYELDSIWKREINSKNDYFIPATLAHKVEMEPWTITIFIKNKISKVWDNDFIWWHFVDLNKDWFDEIEKWFWQEILDLNFKREILKTVLEKFLI